MSFRHLQMPTAILSLLSGDHPEVMRHQLTGAAEAAYQWILEEPDEREIILTIMAEECHVCVTGVAVDCQINAILARKIAFLFGYRGTHDQTRSVRLLLLRYVVAKHPKVRLM